MTALDRILLARAEEQAEGARAEEPVTIVPGRCIVCGGPILQWPLAGPRPRTCTVECFRERQEVLRQRRERPAAVGL